MKLITKNKALTSKIVRAFSGGGCSHQLTRLGNMSLTHWKVQGNTPKEPYTETSFLLYPFDLNTNTAFKFPPP
jgi:hypothetical protein